MKALGWIVGVPLVLLWIIGAMQIFGGCLAGAGLVVGMMLTLDRIPGFKAFACTALGMIVVLVGTGWLSHYLFSMSSFIGMVAFVTSLILKIVLIESWRVERNPGYVADWG
jgi:hypothetical protein